jgi:hypothetical protein
MQEFLAWRWTPAFWLLGFPGASLEVAWEGPNNRALGVGENLKL